jgi:hypothetical protein
MTVTFFSANATPVKYTLAESSGIVLADADGSTILTVVAPSFEGLAW